MITHTDGSITLTPVETFIHERQHALFSNAYSVIDASVEALNSISPIGRLLLSERFVNWLSEGTVYIWPTSGRVLLTVKGNRIYAEAVA